MSTKLQALLAQANEVVAESGVDMNEASKGGGGRLLPEGYAFGRLVEYIEYGMRPQEFNGQAKQPALEFRLGFALWGQGYQNEDGTPYVIRPWNIALSRNEKSKAFKLFKCLNWKGTAKGFAQMLGMPILVKIVHMEKSKTDKAKVSRVDLAGFLPPLDPMSRQPYQIPEAPDDLYKMFLWDRPTKEAWDALHIDGVDNEGKSKNYIQEEILAALDFEGSALQQLLAGTIPDIPSKAPAAPVAALPAVPKATPGPVASVAPARPAMPSPALPGQAPWDGVPNFATPA